MLAHAWAYYSGTSFATPIISALAARALEGRKPESVDTRQAIISASRGQRTVWTRVADGKDESGPMIWLCGIGIPTTQPSRNQ